jgi:hypothetical protein
MDGAAEAFSVVSVNMPTIAAAASRALRTVDLLFVTSINVAHDFA